MPVCHYWLLLLGGKRVNFPSARTKIPLLRKNFRRVVVENYRRQQHWKPGGEQPISP